MVNEIGKNGGHWSKEEHLKQNGLHTFNNGVCDWVINNFKPNNVLEFGCGMGYYSSYFSRKGVDTVHGVEPKFMGNELFDEENNCLQFNFDITVDDIPEKIKNTKYDVLFTLEVMEHIDRKFHDKIFDFFTEKSDIIVFSGARIGQVGHGHISCRDELDWRSEFIKRGYRFKEDLTKDVRISSNKININHRKNIQVFIK